MRPSRVDFSLKWQIEKGCQLLGNFTLRLSSQHVANVDFHFAAAAAKKNMNFSTKLKHTVQKLTYICLLFGISSSHEYIDSFAYWVATLGFYGALRQEIYLLCCLLPSTKICNILVPNQC